MYHLVLIMNLKTFGPFAYYLKALGEVRSLKSFRMKFETDAEIIEEEILLFFILNGVQAGGFNNLIKDADYSDGLMDAIIKIVILLMWHHFFQSCGKRHSR